MYINTYRGISINKKGKEELLTVLSMKEGSNYNWSLPERIEGF